MSRVRRFVWTVEVVLASTLIAFTTPVLAEEKINEKREVDRKCEVSIDNLNGSVTVTGWNRQEIHVTGTLGEGVERLDITGDRKRMEIKVVYPENARNVKESHLVVHIPEAGSPEVSTVSADIKVDKVKGRIQVSSVSGDIRAEGKPAEVSATTVSGTIHLPVESDRVAANSVSGDIILDNVRGAIATATVSGDTRITGAIFRNLTVETFSGDIIFEGNLEAESVSDINSHSGDIILSYPANVGATFDINTFSGDIENDFGKDGERTSKFAPGSELRFSTGSGKASVKINTFSGDITLNEK